MQTVWLLVFMGSCVYSQAAKLPPSFQKCVLEAPNFSECFTKAVSNAIGQLTKPFPSVGLPTLDPLDIESLILTPRDPVITVDINFTNIKLYGYSKLQVEKAELSKDKKQLVIEGVLPELKQIAHYCMNGTVMQLFIHGEGESEVKWYNMSLVNTFTLDEYEKKGHKYWKVTKTDLKLPAETGLFKFENLFNDHNSSEMINKMLNDNFKELYAIGKSFYLPSLAEVNQLMANSFFSKVPISNIFA